MSMSLSVLRVDLILQIWLLHLCGHEVKGLWVQGREERGEGWRKPGVKMEGDMEGERRRPRRRMSTRILRDGRKVEARGRGSGLVPLPWSPPGELP